MKSIVNRMFILLLLGIGGIFAYSYYYQTTMVSEVSQTSISFVEIERETPEVEIAIEPIEAEEEYTISEIEELEPESEPEMAFDNFLEDSITEDEELFSEEVSELVEEISVIEAEETLEEVAIVEEVSPEVEVATEAVVATKKISIIEQMFPMKT